jgi:hypothetical protein
MRVVIKGVNPAERPFHLMCDHCRTVIELIQKELTASCDQRDPGSYINCPTCQKMIWDNPAARSKASSEVSRAHTRNVSNQRTYRDQDDPPVRDLSNYDDPEEELARNSFRGPLPPPELPHYVKTTRALTGK